MELQNFKKYFISEDDILFLNKNFGKYKEKWFESVFLYITEDCQLKCKHCYLGERLKRRSQMTIDQIKTHLIMWKDIGAKRVCFIGGEPTLHPDYPEAIRYANNLGYDVIMDTNGVPSSLDVLKKFSNTDFKIVQVSLDGATPETHDKIRGEGTFQFTINTIKELCRLKFNVWIISTLNKINIKDGLKIVELADQYGVNLVKFHICTYEGNSKKSPEIILNPDEWIKFIKLILQEGKKFKTKILYQPAFANDELGKLYFEEGYSGCLAKQLCKISVFPDGKIYLCSCLFDTNLNFAEMVGNKIKLNRKASELPLFINNVIKIECNDCHFLNHCHGGCPAEKAIQNFTAYENNTELFSICRLWKSKV